MFLHRSLEFGMSRSTGERQRQKQPAGEVRSVREGTPDKEGIGNCLGRESQVHRE